MMEAFQVSEQQEKYPTQQKVLERLLHCIWSEQLFRKSLQVEGKTLLISSPGWWNLEAGPDFRNAEIFLDGARFCGDVEIHLHSGDWYHHRHHQDPRYNNVILHVVLYSSQSACFKENGERIQELEMKDQLLEELRMLQKKIPIHQFPFGPETNVRLCRKFIEENNDEEIVRILDSAGDLRMRRKKEAFLERIRAGDFEQAFYEGLMEGMGYKQSRYAFRELARRVPFAELIKQDLPKRRGIDSMAAVLLGTAGLLQEYSQISMQNTDPETSTYVGELFGYWRKVSSRYEPHRLIGFCWYPSSTRPANFPARRITAVAAFFHYHGSNLLPLFLTPLEHAEPNARSVRTVLKLWIGLFSKPIHLYWSYHFQFDCVKFSAPKRLIGRERAKILIVNLVLPALLAYADVRGDSRLEHLLHTIYRFHPKLADNSITRLMEHRLFGNRDKSRTFLKTAHRQQALHHFFYDFCDNREASCSRCELRNEHRILVEE
jgi:hypothetical protein